MRGVVTLRIKDMREFMQIILINSDPCYNDAESCFAVNNSGEYGNIYIKIATISSNSKPTSKNLNIPSKGRESSLSVKKLEVKISLDCPFNIDHH
jgi:hypothetical protein